MGAGLALGAPLGWLLLRAGAHRLTGGSIEGELAANLGVYLYMLLGCLGAFIGFGARLGRLAERLAEADALHARESITDGLTTLYNSRYFHRRFREEVALARRTGRPLGLVLADLDYFKQLNDRLGHAAGDLALVRVGQTLRDGCRASDVACRIGGEEFAVVCPETSVETAVALAERLRVAVESMGLRVGGAPVSLTASFGVGQWSEGMTEHALFEEVDAALYVAKTGGRNRVRTVAPQPGGSAGLA